MKIGQWLGIVALVLSIYILVMANQVALLPAVTLSAQIFFTIFFGALGLFMAIPLTVVTKTWIEEVLFQDILDRWQKPA